MLESESETYQTCCQAPPPAPPPAPASLKSSISCRAMHSKYAFVLTPHSQFHLEFSEKDFQGHKGNDVTIFSIFL